MIKLVAGPFPKIVEGEISVGGFDDWSRIQWLNSDLNDIASRTAALCHQLSVDPVVRVGGSSKGYSTLAKNSGVTDLGDPIKNFPWDVFQPLLTSAYNTPLDVPVEAPAEIHGFVDVPNPETHLYGDEPDSEVEEAAIRGEDEALTQVIALAAGEDKSDSARAKSVLAQVPQEVLEFWNETHK